MGAELHIMNCVLSDAPSHKVGCEEQHSIIKWKQYISDWARAGPEGRSKLDEEVAQMPMAPLLLLYLLFPSLHLWHHGKFSTIS